MKKYASNKKKTDTLLLANAEHISPNQKGTNPPPFSVNSNPVQRFGIGSMMDSFSDMAGDYKDSFVNTVSEKYNNTKNNILEALPATFPDDHPQVQQLQAELDQLKAFEKTIEEKNKEEMGTERNELVSKIGTLRANVECMAFNGLSEKQIKMVKSWIYKEINEISPYYIQSRAVDFLEKKGGTLRLCNLTSLAMALEALGKSSADYQGNMETIKKIRNYKGKGGDFNYKKSFDKAKLTTSSDLGGLRLPDFLQLAMVAWRMERGNSLLKSVEQAWNDVLSMGRFATVAQKFGVSTNIITKLSGGKSRQEKYENTLGKELEAGKQIVLLIPGHYVRLQAITDEGLIVDDPGRSSKKNLLKPWAETKGYFRKALVISG